MRIGLVCPELPGHLNPLTTLGGELARRGHDVCLIAAPRAAAAAERAGLELFPIGLPEEDDGSAAAGWNRLGELTGMAALSQTGWLLHQATVIIQRDLPVAIRAGRIQGLVVDQFSPAAVLVAENQALPYVVACNALACHYGDHVPPPPLLWRYRPDWLGRLRNRAAKHVLTAVFNWFADVRQTKVPPLKLIFEHEFGLAQVAQQPAFFDFPRHDLPEHLHYTAPWHEPARDDELAFPWDRIDDRPLVYASLGTLQNKLRHVYVAIAEAAAGLDVQMVLALGDRQASLDFQPPENVLVVPFAPQLRLLERAAVAITHAGLNTALECIAAGVPMVCLPITNDQPGVAMRVEHLGLGEVLPIGRATSSRIRDLLIRVLHDPAYRETAGQYRQQLANTSGPAMAASIIDQAFASGRRVTRTEVELCTAKPGS